MNNISTARYIMKSGIYSGDSTANKAVAHGLGSTPRFIIIYDASNKITAIMGYAYFTYFVGGSSPATYAVTAWTTSNFYIGSAAADFFLNVTGANYRWVAFG